MTKEEILKYQLPDLGKIRGGIQQKGIKNLWEGGGALTQIEEYNIRLKENITNLYLPAYEKQRSSLMAAAQENISKIEKLRGIMELPEGIWQGQALPTGYRYYEESLGKPVSAAMTPTQKYGGVITLPSGQKISPQDPNYATYAKQAGIIAPAPKIPETISTDILTKDNDIAGIKGEAKINQDYLDKVKVSYDKYGGQAGANEAFVVGAARAAGQEADLSLVGETLRKVLEQYKLNDKLDDFGIEEAFKVPEGKKQIESPADRKNFVEGTIAEDPTGTFLYGTPKTEGAAPEAPPAFDQPAGAEAPATGGDIVDDMYDKLIGDKLVGMAEGIDMDEVTTAKNEAAMEVEKSRQAIVDKQLIDAVELEGISKDQAIPMALISRQQTQYSTDEYITNLKMTQDYNNKLILSKMAEGNFLEAQRINKDIANDVFQIKQLQLDQLLHQEKIKDKEYERMQKEIDYERGLAMEGYSYIPNTDIYNDIVKQYNITPANFDNFIMKDPTNNKMYLRPLTTEADDYLSVSEATTLGVPYGTTKQEAMSMGISPADVGKVKTYAEIIATLTPQNITAGNKLAKDLYGASVLKSESGRTAFLNPILARMAAGETVDDIADDLRFKGQSPEFTGTIREAAQQITSNLSAKRTETVFDKLDDLIATKDMGKVRDYLKKIAIENSAGGTEQAKMIMGQERTVEFLDEIYVDLQEFENAGGDTNIFTGTLEEMAKKVGIVKEPELRKIATKIMKARQQYRRSMTGVAFSPGENLEYDAIFPSINKTMDFNTATLEGLKEAFEGDVDFFYSFAMGNDAYNEIFKNEKSLFKEKIDYNISIQSAIDSGYNSSEIIEYLSNDPNMSETINNAKQYYNDDEIIEYLQNKAKNGNFSRVDGDTNEANIREAIGQYESGGNYQIRGKTIPSGQYKGERAMGKYQIMPGNLPSWSKEALGRVVSEKEFLNNPDIQDKIAEYKMAKIYEKYGTVEDVASVWFSGQPMAKAGNKKDVLGTSVPTYIKNIRAIYNKLG